ncbi:MAG: CsiV family protein [Gammaproteobacteria bacterium]
MKLLQTGLLLAVLLLAPPYAVAAAGPVSSIPAPNWYDVELIVFRNTDPQAGSLETWPANPGVPDWNSGVPMNPAGSNLPYMQLSPASFRMDYSWRKLQRSSDYQPLLHIAWAEPAIDRASAPFVRIGEPPTAAPVATTVLPTAAAPPATGTPVYGIAKLSTTGLYLHFDLDLVYCGPPAKRVIPSSAPAAPTAQSAAGIQATQQAAAPAPTPACQPYRLTQDRKLDAGKINYFDHPMFGVLVLVTPRIK